MKLNINKRYNFNTLAPNILGARYENLKVKGILTLDGALKLKDITTQYETMKQFIPTLPDNPDDCTYIVFEKLVALEHDEVDQIVLAYEYIDVNTIEEVNKVNLRLDVYDVVTEDLNIISTRLRELGYFNFKIKVSDGE